MYTGSIMALQQNPQDLEKNVTLGTLLEYTDEFLIPKMSDLMDEKLDTVKNELKVEMTQMRQDMSQMSKEFNSDLGKVNHDLKVYIDERMGTYTSEIFIRLDKKYQKEKDFKQKVVEIFKKNNLGTPEDIAFLEGALSV